MSLFSLENKVAVITGSSRGLGHDIARGYLEAGAAKVFVSSRSQQDSEAAAKKLTEHAKSKGLKGVAVAAAADVSQPDGAEKLLAKVSETESKIDILVANAGVANMKPLEETDFGFIEDIFSTNVKGAHITAKTFVPLLEKAGSAASPSRIIVTGSVAGDVNFYGDGDVYGASKAAVHHLVRSLAIKLGSKHITVNTLAPGLFPTTLSQGIVDLAGEALAKRNPLGRLGQPEDIIGASVFLASPAANYVNGITLQVDGGSVTGINFF